MSRIFVNYRRSDAAAHANLLYDWLRERYGEGRVFKDVETIEPGLDFVDAIESAVGSARVVLVVIGREWVVDAGGRRRLEEPDDYVRLEVERALHHGVRVIPVLVEGAGMPAADELPEPLRPLTRRHAFELSDARSRIDREELLRRLDVVMAGKPERAGARGDETRAGRLHDRLNGLSRRIFVLEVRIVSWPFRALWRLVRGSGSNTAASSG
jgi:hypothetical protein